MALTFGYVHEPHNNAPGTVDILERARFMHGEDAEEWLENPLPILGGLSPNDCMYTGRGRRAVMALLDRSHSW